MNKAKIEKAVRDILEAIGENPDRPGLVETPSRVARMYEEVLAGIQYSNDDLAKMYDKCFEEDEPGGIVVVRDIPCFSYCEHHLALMYNMRISVGYVPNGKVLGLSKVARVADMVCRRLQLQERIGTDISEVLRKILRTEDVIVMIEGEHSCMTARGIKKDGSKTRTISKHGAFLKDYGLVREFLSLVE